MKRHLEEPAELDSQDSVEPPSKVQRPSTAIPPPTLALSEYPRVVFGGLPEWNFVLVKVLSWFTDLKSPKDHPILVAAKNDNVLELLRLLDIESRSPHAANDVFFSVMHGLADACVNYKSIKCIIGLHLMSPPMFVSVSDMDNILSCHLGDLVLYASLPAAPGPFVHAGGLDTGRLSFKSQFLDKLIEENQWNVIEELPDFALFVVKNSNIKISQYSTTSPYWQLVLDYVKGKSLNDSAISLIKRSFQVDVRHRFNDMRLLSQQYGYPQRFKDLVSWIHPDNKQALLRSIFINTSGGSPGHDMAALDMGFVPSIRDIFEFQPYTWEHPVVSRLFKMILNGETQEKTLETIKESLSDIKTMHYDYSILFYLFAICRRYNGGEWVSLPKHALYRYHDAMNVPPFLCQWIDTYNNFRVVNDDADTSRVSNINCLFIKNELIHLSRVPGMIRPLLNMIADCIAHGLLTHVESAKVWTQGNKVNHTKKTTAEETTQLTLLANMPLFSNQESPFPSMFTADGQVSIPPFVPCTLDSKIPEPSGSASVEATAHTGLDSASTLSLKFGGKYFTRVDIAKARQQSKYVDSIMDGSQSGLITLEYRDDQPVIEINQGSLKDVADQEKITLLSLCLKWIAENPSQALVDDQLPKVAILGLDQSGFFDKFCPSTVNLCRLLSLADYLQMDKFIKVVCFKLALIIRRAPYIQACHEAMKYRYKYLLE